MSTLQNTGASTLRIIYIRKKENRSPLGYASSYSFSTNEPYETITGTPFGSLQPKPAIISLRYGVSF